LCSVCSERFYPSDRFESCVRFPFADHNPCFFSMIEVFCQDVTSFLGKDKQNVVAIHCKAGKGRTGFLISCFLLYQGMFTDPALALRFYAIRRTKNAKGVTIPSQIRYVHYFGRYLQLRKLGIPFVASHFVALTSIRLQGIPKMTTNKDVWFKLMTKEGVFESKGKIQPDRRLAEDYLLFSADSRKGILSFDGDCQVEFYCGGLFDTQKMFSCWFNTRFFMTDGELAERARQTGLTQPNGVNWSNATTSGAGSAEVFHSQAPNANAPQLRLFPIPKSDLDKACKDTKHKEYLDTFRVEFIFQSISTIYEKPEEMQSAPSSMSIGGPVTFNQK
jgi:phosphatidylinositol-3,4,5-trisphosphate 3-phosphatase/dual-specificity protein phosphatase PTEN